MTNFDVTLSYKAVIEIAVKANSEEEAKKKALEYFRNKEREKWYNSKEATLQDDSFKVCGVLDRDESWGNL